MTDVERLTAAARHRKPDYSPEFTEAVRRLGEVLSERLGIPIRHDSTMNYRVSQMLEVLLDSGASPAASAAEAAFLLKIVLSSLVPAWTVFAFHQGELPSHWVPVNAADVWRTLPAAHRDVIAATLDGAGLVQVLEGNLGALVDGAITELEGAPATVKDVLFCELC